MAITTSTAFDLTIASLHLPNHQFRTVSAFSFNVTAKSSTFPRMTFSNRRSGAHLIAFSAGRGDGSNGGGGYGGGGGKGDGGGENERKDAALFPLAEIGRSLDSLPKDLAMVIESGRIHVEIVMRYCELEKPPLKRWLLQFWPMKERLLADDLFLQFESSLKYKINKHGIKSERSGMEGDKVEEISSSLAIVEKEKGKGLMEFKRYINDITSTYSIHISTFGEDYKTVSYS